MKTLADRIAIAICGCAVMFVIIGGSVSTRPPEIDAAVLAAVNPQEPAVAGSGFAPNGVIPGLISTVRGVELYGSYVSGTTLTGTVRTRWYRPMPSFYVLLAGFPDHKRGYIYLELNTRTGLRRQELNLDEDPEYWRLHKISLRDVGNVTTFRIVATEVLTGSTCWIGFSQPFTIHNLDTLEVLKQLLLVILCSAACVVGIVGPGLVLRARSTR